MAKTISSLSVVLGATVAPLVGAFRSAGQATESLQSSIASTAGSLLKITGVAAIVAGGLSAMRGVFGSLGDSIGLAADLEQNAVAFETMTGSAATAKTLMEQLNAFAASTPFEFPELAASAKKLLAFGTSADKIVPTLKMLGDIASGIGTPVNELAELFGKMKVQGTLYAEDLNQLLGRGIPVIKEFAKQLGVSESEVKKMASEGKISFAMLEKAMQSMTAKGGQFSGMMEKQSGTLGGLWSTFTDTVSMTMAGMVQTIVDAFQLKGALSSLIGFAGSVGAWLQNMIGRIAPIVMNVGGKIVGGIGAIFADMYAVAAPVVTGLYNFLTSNWTAMYDAAAAAFTAVYTAVAGTLSAVWSFVQPIVVGIAQVIRDNWLGMVTTVIGYFNSIFNVISSVLSAAWRIVSTTASAIGEAWSWAMDLLGLSTKNAQGQTESAFGGIVSAVQWFYDTVSLAFNVLAFGIENFQDVIAAAMLASAYEVVRFGNQVAYFFTDMLPAYLSWFGDNWSNVFMDQAALTATVFSNMGKNVANFFGALWGALKGEGFNFQWTGLTEGFKSTLTELPKIAERQVGPLEKSLGDASAAMNDQLAKGLGEYLNEQDAKTKAAADAIKGVAGGIGKSIGEAFGSAGKTGMDDMANDVAGFFQDATPPLDVNNAPALAAIGQVKAAATDLKTVFAGSAESAQMQAQAAFAARMAAPTAAAVPPSASQNEIAARGKADTSWLNTPEAKQIFQTIAKNTSKTADNTGEKKLAVANG